MNWSYGITTVPARVNTLLVDTLASLAAAGFHSPRLFIDGVGEALEVSEKEYPITIRSPALGGFGNFALAALELSIRDPHADRYAIFQDDILVCKNLKEYLEASPYPEKSYLNLMTMESNHPVAQGRPADTTGWYQTDQLARGAQALVFNNIALRSLLTQRHFIDRPTTNSKRSTRGIDGTTVGAMNNAGYKEWVHYPSLVQHVGRVSAMNNTWKGDAPSYVG
jgi:hypothetical protein